MRIFRRVKAAQAPASPPTDDNGRLDDLLAEWGEYVVRYSGSGRLWWPRRDPSFALAGERVTDDGSYEPGSVETADPDKLRTIDAAVDDVRRVELALFMILHWHYASPNGRGPAVWRHRALPKFATDEYVELLNRARSELMLRLQKRAPQLFA